MCCHCLCASFFNIEDCCRRVVNYDIFILLSSPVHVAFGDIAYMCIILRNIRLFADFAISLLIINSVLYYLQCFAMVNARVFYACALYLSLLCALL